MSKALGRPASTTRDELARTALVLFAEHGFDATTLDEIAEAAGVSSRTVLRYYRSKNDIVWGAFDEQLDALRQRLSHAPPGEPLLAAIRREVLAFNDYGDDALDDLRSRMTLITTVPALQGHAMIRYAAWSDAIAEFVAARTRCGVEGFVPQLIASAALGVAMTAYRTWIADPDGPGLLDLMDEGFELVGRGLTV
jgi:mycofactocin system transcriptional regulator